MNISIRNILLIKIQTLLFLSIPFLLFARFFADLFLVIICIIFIFQSYNYRLHKYYNNFYFKFFLVFWFYLIIRSIFTKDIDSIISSFAYIRFAIFSIAIWYLLDTDKKLLNKFFKILFFTFVIYIVDGYYQSIFGKDIFFIKNLDPLRVTAFFGEEQILGSFFSRLFPLLVGLYFLVKKNDLNNEFVYLPFVTLLSFLVVLTGERTAIFFFVFSLLIIIFFTKPFLLKKVAILFLCIIFFLIFSNTKIYKSNIDNRIYYQTSQNLFKNDRVYFATDVHEAHILTAYKIFIDNPLFGVGNKMFRKVCQDPSYVIYKGCTTHPHNVVFQILSELGLIGFFFYIVVLFYLIINFIKNFYYNDKIKYFVKNYKTCLLFCFIISLFPLAPSGNFFNNWLSIVFYLPVGFYLHYFYDKKKE
jgi:O-antigen ligase